MAHDWVTWVDIMQRLRRADDLVGYTLRVLLVWARGARDLNHKRLIAAQALRRAGGDLCRIADDMDLWVAADVAAGDDAKGGDTHGCDNGA